MKEPWTLWGHFKVITFTKKHVTCNYVIFLVQVPRRRNSGWKNRNDLLLNFPSRKNMPIYTLPCSKPPPIILFSSTYYYYCHFGKYNQTYIWAKLTAIWPSRYESLEFIKKLWLHRRKVCFTKQLLPFAGLVLSPSLGRWCSTVMFSVRLRCPA